MSNPENMPDQGQTPDGYDEYGDVPDTQDTPNMDERPDVDDSPLG